MALNTALLYGLWCLYDVLPSQWDKPAIAAWAGAGYVSLQVFLMSRFGQSLGKYCFNIRVLDKNGSNPGFLGTVLAREIFFGFLLIVFKVFGALPYLVCLLMLFIPACKRLTLQDRLMGSVVIKVSKTDKNKQI